MNDFRLIEEKQFLHCFYLFHLLPPPLGVNGLGGDSDANSSGDSDGDNNVKIIFPLSASFPPSSSSTLSSSGSFALATRGVAVP